MNNFFALILFAFLASDSMAFTHRIRRQTQLGNNASAQPSTTTPNGQLTQAETQACVQSCPVTSEYNPVCGSNNVTYSNPGRLNCAQFCGVNVTLVRSFPCRAN